MHILDLIMYFVCAGIIWFILDKGWKGEFTQGLGGIIGLMIIAVYTIIYVILFAFCGLNWVDFHWSSLAIHFKW